MYTKMLQLDELYFTLGTYSKNKLNYVNKYVYKLSSEVFMSTIITSSYKWLH